MAIGLALVTRQGLLFSSQSRLFHIGLECGFLQSIGLLHNDSNFLVIDVFCS